MTGVCTFYNKTRVDWYCKQQSTSKTATYKAEFLSRRKCYQNIIDHRAYLWYLGKPVANMDYVCGNNESMINSVTVPDAKLHRRHNILSFHCVKSMVVQGYINMQHIVSTYNISDTLTKHLSYQSRYHELIQHVFHHAGNTAALFLDNTLELDDSMDKGTIFGLLASDRTLLQS